MRSELHPAFGDTITERFWKAVNRLILRIKLHPYMFPVDTNVERFLSTKLTTRIEYHVWNYQALNYVGSVDGGLPDDPPNDHPQPPN